MANLNPLITFKVFWAPETTECQQCVGCSDIIYSTAYRMMLECAGKVSATEYVVCEACYNAIEPPLASPGG